MAIEATVISSLPWFLDQSILAVGGMRPWISP